VAKRAKVGDVVEVPTDKGLAYAHFTHKDPQWGSLLRVLPGLFTARPATFTDLVLKDAIFVSFFPLQAALNRGIFEVVTNCPVPPKAADFPLFRAPGWADKTGKVLDWWLWDGQKSWQIGTLTEEQRELPIKEVINDTLLIERIQDGWTPANDIS
jgi:hypothetical protein